MLKISTEDIELFGLIDNRMFNIGVTINFIVPIGLNVCIRLEESK